jgi:hypothetical protein
MISDTIIHQYIENKDCYKVMVKLTYFKNNGKYYSQSEYMEDYLPLYQIWDKIKSMDKHPGLSMKWDGLIAIDIPEHINNHPHIIVM